MAYFFVGGSQSDALFLFDHFERGIIDARGEDAEIDQGSQLQGALDWFPDDVGDEFLGDLPTNALKQETGGEQGGQDDDHGAQAVEIPL